MERLVVLYKYFKTMEHLTKIGLPYKSELIKAKNNLLIEYKKNKNFYSQYVELLDIDKAA